MHAPHRRSLCPHARPALLQRKRDEVGIGAAVFRPEGTRKKGIGADVYHLLEVGRGRIHSPLHFRPKRLCEIGAQHPRRFFVNLHEAREEIRGAIISVIFRATLQIRTKHAHESFVIDEKRCDHGACA
jgi:hypothetical protein